ncbi:hypothetical protein BRC97_00880 [Halobacteriales archaeon QS_6_71_20]|nr:MAG: hypothetical protein BRC97_00880 [Halobacteriales archaeon QS_6_71_20]
MNTATSASIAPSARSWPISRPRTYVDSASRTTTALADSKKGPYTLAGPTDTGRVGSRRRRA